MRSGLCQRVVHLTLAGAWTCALALAPAHAAPPLGKLGDAITHSNERSSEPGAQRLPARRLDLTAPAAHLPEPSASSAVATFPMSARRGFGASEPHLAPLGADTGLFAARAMSRPEALARNFRREGLPVAKLFQNDTALVHLGLSPKGKPGLWIVEKIH